MKAILYGRPTANGEKFVLAAESASLTIVRITARPGEVTNPDDIAGNGSAPLIITGEDIALPLLKHRSGPIRYPVIVIPERDGMAADLLDAGADDVITAPLSGREIVSRIRTIMRRIAGLGGGDVSVGDVNVRLNDGSASVSGVRVRLSASEAEILRALALNHPRTLTRESIYDKLYALSEDPPQSRVVDVHVCNLRRKLAKADPQGRNLIKAVPGVGYGLA